MSALRLVVDSNVWIDLQAGGLLRAEVLAPLGAELLVPDVLLAEVNPVLAASIRSVGMREVSLEGEQVARVAALAGGLAARRRPSVVDLFALLVAQARGGILVTGDANLRRIACDEAVTVHGSLWLLERLVAGGLVAEAAAVALQQMLAAGRRLPLREANELLRRWGRGHR